MVLVSIQWYRQGSFDITLHTTGLMWCWSVFSGIGRAPLISTGLMWCWSVFSGIDRAPLISPYTDRSDVVLYSVVYRAPLISSD